MLCHCFNIGCEFGGNDLKATKLLHVIIKYDISDLRMLLILIIKLV